MIHCSAPRYTPQSPAVPSRRATTVRSGGVCTARSCAVGTCAAGAAAQAPLGLNADCTTAFTARQLEWSRSAIRTPFGAWFSHPTHHCASPTRGSGAVRVSRAGEVRARDVHRARRRGRHGPARAGGRLRLGRPRRARGARPPGRGARPRARRGDRHQAPRRARRAPDPARARRALPPSASSPSAGAGHQYQRASRRRSRSFRRSSNRNSRCT